MDSPHIVAFPVSSAVTLFIAKLPVKVTRNEESLPRNLSPMHM